MPKALFVEIEAKDGSSEEIAAFLHAALEKAQGEADTRDWYAVRFDDRHFGIFDTFDGMIGRLKHLVGGIGRGLVMKSMTSLEGAPDMSSYEIVAAKLPTAPAGADMAPMVGLYAAIETRLGQGRDFGEVLVAGREMVAAESGAVAWYALRSGPNSYAVVAVFADEAARQAHLDGAVPTAIAGTVGRFLDGMPEMRRFEVMASKQSGWLELASAHQEMHPEQAVRVAPESA